MDIATLQRKLAEHLMSCEGNTIQAEYALSPDIAGTRLYDAPLVGCARADDALFARIKSDDKILGDTFVLPEEWLPGAKSVVSIFFPFSEAVRISNYGDLRVPSNEWLHGRIEGQAFVQAAVRVVEGWLHDEGFETRAPGIDPEFAVQMREPEEAIGLPMFRSNWSERHVAFVSGLGTFGLCTHLITQAGKAGRFGSIVTTAQLEPTPRPYGEDPFAYCTFCGACIDRCPVNALSLEHGKNYAACYDYIQDTKARFKPRFGCGKCQLVVPCETGIPNERYAISAR